MNEPNEPNQPQTTTAPQQAAQQPVDNAGKPSDDAAAGDAAAEKRNHTAKYIERLQRQNADLRAKLGRKPQGENSEQPKQAAEEPSLESCNYDMQEFIRQQAQYTARRERDEFIATAQRQADESQFAKLHASYVERANAFAQDHPDYVEAVSGLEDYGYLPIVQATIMDHARGPEIAYYLANNEDDAFDLARTPPMLVAKAIARIERRMGATNRTEPTNTNAITKAPPPPARVTSRSAVEPNPAKMTDSDWYARFGKGRRRS